MIHFTKEATENTPKIDINTSTGTVLLKGVSYPENAMKFYDEIQTLIKEYASDPQEATKVHLELYYFNTSTTREILKLLLQLKETDSDVTIDWYYKENSTVVLEKGQDFSQLVGLDFNYVKTS